jgi:hypothetical protein
MTLWLALPPSRNTSTFARRVGVSARPANASPATMNFLRLDIFIGSQFFFGYGLVLAEEKNSWFVRDSAACTSRRRIPAMSFDGRNRAMFCPLSRFTHTVTFLFFVEEPPVNRSAF